ncbi:type III secretion system chaperone [Pantoea sp. BAV 3049]|uniref:type III secretion system chaperone n=1 Tax=Pantoea sp. BAV 3049 TaxID=2654188 RepID=UPI00131CFD5D|nr:type III secretion system chaperone [Pantoea sp. BAV 3049]
MSATEQLNHCLALYGRRQGISLGLRDGVCALVDHKQQEVAVVELPLESDCVLFHCKTEELKGATSERYLRTLLALNFEMSAMRGCWLALDGDDNLRLCSQQSVAGLEVSHFAQCLDGFILQAQQVSEFIRELKSAS